MLSRRSLLAGAAAVAAVPLLTPARAMADAPTTDWVQWLAQRRDHVSLYADDGRGRRLALRPNHQVPMASAYKAIHAATFAGSGISPQRQIKIRDWEAPYLPGLDGGAHPAALTRLNIPNDGRRATDPDQLVPLDWVVQAAIMESDNAAADYLRDLLGVPALRRTAACGGWPNAEMATELGDMLRLWWPGTSEELSARFLSDASFKQAALAKLAELPTPQAQLAWTPTTHRGTALDVAALHRSIATGRIPGRRYLEQLLAGALLPGELGIGFKGGELPGVLNFGLSLRRADGTIATTAVLATGLPLADYLTLHDGQVDYFVQVVLGMLRDPVTWQRVARDVVHA
ncbi:serine hydrolase [Kutzneria chonburiensis]|uniref:Beta-lactamase n=1 Tax=Kutzneria chonburiensis TaxID=1483604 RepID=A0ABV6MJB0_9PSEU|nr:serine hydrolase [Kutzneria chonburiensis]